MTPVCPKCGSAMVLRTAGRGRNAGRQFWGCSKFPRCRGTVDEDSQVGRETRADSPGGEHAEGPVVDSAAYPSERSVSTWRDATLERPGWACRYETVGASLRAFPDSLEVAKRFATCWLGVSEGEGRVRPQGSQKV